MSTETEKTEAIKNVPMPMPTGGQVSAVVPQTVEEIFRIAKGVVVGGLAPQALTGKITTPDDFQRALSAVSVVIMAGAELGLPAMSSLRSFTVINGRPSLYADGLINVIRRSGKAKTLQMGFTRGAKGQYDDDAFGWCEATRGDTGETYRYEFSVEDAKRAALWDDRAKAKRFKKDGTSYEAINDAPWYRYPSRMLMWRAAGYCLRMLFGDVLGGITDEYEARSIPEYGEYTEVESAAPSSPPPSLRATTAEPKPDDKPPYVDVPKFLTDLDESLSAGMNEEAQTELWDNLFVEITLVGNDEALEKAFAIRKRHAERIETPGQEDHDEEEKGYD